MAGAPTVLEAVRLSEGYLRKYGVESPRLSAEHLLARALGCSRLELYLRFEEYLAEDTMKIYRADLKKRSGHYPLQYLLGEIEFVSLPFRVREGVFIPRPETELLVEWIEEAGPSGQGVRFLEFGAGTGIISGALAKRNSSWEGVAFDISEAAVRLAGENFSALGVSERVCTFVSSGFEALGARKTFGLLVSNPPYIPAGQIDGLQKEIAYYENRTALDGGDDGLKFYPVLAEAGETLLKPGGMIAMEVGDGQAESIFRILQNTGYERIEARKDYNGHERMVMAFRPLSAEGDV